MGDLNGPSQFPASKSKVSQKPDKKFISMNGSEEVLISLKLPIFSTMQPGTSNFEN